jgi:hypothetical protein
VRACTHSYVFEDELSSFTHQYYFLPIRPLVQRWTASAPLAQKKLLDSPKSAATGQPGHRQSTSREMQMKLVPWMQKRRSRAFLAQSVYVGQSGQMHMPVFSVIIFVRSEAGILLITIIAFSNLSIRIPMKYDSSTYLKL